MHQIAQYFLISADFRIDLRKEDTQWLAVVQVRPVFSALPDPARWSFRYESSFFMARCLRRIQIDARPSSAGPAITSPVGLKREQ